MTTALHEAFRLRWRSSHWRGGNGCQQKQKKSIDQRAPQIGYEGIKSLRSLAMKNYLVTGGLLSLVESYNNIYYQTSFCQIPPDILTNLGCIWQSFRWAKYEKMSQNIW